VKNRASEYPTHGRNTLVYRSKYTIFFKTTSQQGLCVHQTPTSCSILHSSVRSLTGRSRLQHLLFGTLSPSTRSADTIRTVKSRLKTDLFTSAPIERFSAPDSLATRAPAIDFVLTLTLKKQSVHTGGPLLRCMRAPRA